MSTDVAAAIAADKATTEAATTGPWTWTKHRVPELTGIAGDENYSFEEAVVYADHNGECGCRSACNLELNVIQENREFIAAARTRWPVYIAAIEAVIRLCDADAVTMYPYADDDFPGDKVVLVEDVRRALAVLAVPSTPNKEQR